MLSPCIPILALSWVALIAMAAMLACPLQMVWLERRPGISLPWSGHVLPQYVDSWHYPSSANPEASYTLLNRESPSLFDSLIHRIIELWKKPAALVT